MHVSAASSSMSGRCPKAKPHYAVSLLEALDLGAVNFVLASAFVFLLLLPPSCSCYAQQLVTAFGQNIFWCSCTCVDVAHWGIPFLHNIKHKWWRRRSIVSLPCPVRLLPLEHLPFWLASCASCWCLPWPYSVSHASCFPEQIHVALHSWQLCIQTLSLAIQQTRWIIEVSTLANLICSALLAWHPSPLGTLTCTRFERGSHSWACTCDCITTGLVDGLQLQMCRSTSWTKHMWTWTLAFLFASWCFSSLCCLNVASAVAATSTHSASYTCTPAPSATLATPQWSQSLANKHIMQPVICLGIKV